MEPYIEDCRVLLSEMKEQDKALRLKRRWLMDLPLSEREQKRMKKLSPLMDKTIPEALLREDDVYYDNIRIFVERGFGVHNLVKEKYLFQENLQLCDSYGSLKNPLALLDEMTNNGLYCFAELVTNGSVEYEKTRWKMKKIINECLPTFLSQGNNNFQMRKDKISHLLKDPKHFRGNHAGLCPPTEAFRAAAIGVLNRLEELPPQTLSAMHRRLKGKRGYFPKLEHIKSPRKRDLIGPVRNRCMEMLFELDDREEPQEPLAKALAVAGLTLKLILGRSSVIEFQKFSPEVEALQNNIAKAIGLINTEKKVTVMKLEALCKKLHNFPDVKFSKRNLRSAIRNLFIEYLLECSDMDVIPEYVLEALSEINRCHSSSWSSSKDEIQEEVEFLLCLSAQTKQIVWDLHPELEVDLDFSDAYMEDLEESDDEEEEEVELRQNCKFRSCDSSGLTESMGETNPMASESPVSLRKDDAVSSLLSPDSRLNIKLETMHISEMDSVQSHDFARYSFSPESKVLNSTQSFNGNEHQLGSLERFIWPDLHTLVSPTNQSEFSSTPSGLGTEGRHKVKRQEIVNGCTGNVELPYSGPQSGGVAIFHPKQSTNANQYLSIQKASDETTMAMYHIIGSMLNEFAQAQNLDLTHGDVSYLRSHGDISYLRSHASNHSKVAVSEDKQTTCESDMSNSVFIHVLEELMPSFSESAKKKLMKLMDYS